MQYLHSFCPTKFTLVGVDVLVNVSSICIARCVTNMIAMCAGRAKLCFVSQPHFCFQIAETQVHTKIEGSNSDAKRMQDTQPVTHAYLYRRSRLVWRQQLMLDEVSITPTEGNSRSCCGSCC